MATSREPKTMRGWSYTTSTGGIEKTLTLRTDLPIPTLRSNRAEVLIQTISASINPADYKLPEIPALLRSAIVVRTPATPGGDFCGRIVSLTPAATTQGFEMGDVVFGRLDPQQHGTLAEFFPAPAAACTKIPLDLVDKVSPDQAACLGIAGLTAYQAIAPNVEAGRGDKVFINGGAGGVGTMAIQIAKVLGCHVTVSCSPAKRDLCQRLGADEIIDYTQGRLVETLKAKGKVFSVVVDNAFSPQDLYTASNDFMIPGRSKFVQVGAHFALGVVAEIAKRQVVPGFLGGGRNPYGIYMIRNDREAAEQLARWVGEGKLEVVIEETFEFEKVREAFAKLKTGRCFGKLVVRVANLK